MSTPSNQRPRQVRPVAPVRPHSNRQRIYQPLRREGQPRLPQLQVTNGVQFRYPTAQVYSNQQHLYENLARTGLLQPVILDFEVDNQGRPIPTYTRTTMAHPYPLMSTTDDSTLPPPTPAPPGEYSPEEHFGEEYAQEPVYHMESSMMDHTQYIHDDTISLQDAWDELPDIPRRMNSSTPYNQEVPHLPQYENITDVSMETQPPSPPVSPIMLDEEVDELARLYEIEADLPRLLDMEEDDLATNQPTTSIQSSAASTVVSAVHIQSQPTSTETSQPSTSTNLSKFETDWTELLKYIDEVGTRPMVRKWPQAKIKKNALSLNTNTSSNHKKSNHDKSIEIVHEQRTNSNTQTATCTTNSDSQTSARTRVHRPPRPQRPPPPRPQRPTPTYTRHTATQTRSRRYPNFVLRRTNSNEF